MLKTPASESWYLRHTGENGHATLDFMQAKASELQSSLLPMFSKDFLVSAAVIMQDNGSTIAGQPMIIITVDHSKLDFKTSRALSTTLISSAPTAVIVDQVVRSISQLFLNTCFFGSAFYE